MDDELDAIEQYLESRQDVVDGDYGIPEPNEEMRLLQNLRDARHKELHVDETDIDLMRDVYMTGTQRKAYERILAVAKQ